MKKKIIGIIVAFILIAAVIPLSVVSANAGNQLDHVSITPDSVVLPLGGTQQFSAVGENEDNQPVNGVLYSWEVVNGGGTIDPITGFFTAGDTIDEFTDTVKVTATKGGITVTAYADVTVAIQGALDKVVVTPETVILVPGGTQQFSATAKDAFDQTLSDVDFTWEVVGGIGIINPATGYFTAGDVTGTFTDSIKVTAIQDGVIIIEYADVTVANHGDLDTVVISPDSVTIEPLGTQQFTAVGYDAYGDPIESGVDFTWNVINGGGTIDPDTGFFTVFTAGDVIDTFIDTIKVTAVQGTVTKYEYATVIVAEPSPEKEYCVPPGWSHGNKNGWGDGDTPPGWSKGNKTGWDGKGYPPGLAKEK